MQTMVPAGADKIWAEDSGGDGPALLLLHEGVGDARMWDPIWPAVTSAYRAIRYDVRGFSMGGGTAIQLALARPDLVKSLLLLCPGIPGYPYPEADPAVEAQFEAAEAAGDVDGLIRMSLQQWGRTGDHPMVTDLMRSAIRAWDNQQRFMQEGEPVYERLAELRVPVTLMVGDVDNPGLIASNEAAAARIPGCELIRLPGVDHYPTVRAPQFVTETILRHCTG